ncbi:hypothetical protein Nepgr_031086 [Nepenthes gracilis]|uniref:Protein kinase domain-containing protein n=1 Tax=Nepenthes gracilis TaxID=150966 RepID=A0AAD3THT7_NEPGR|nr:hypothetical protein Nepgr_031086 [Nepenthes gracilis]
MLEQKDSELENQAGKPQEEDEITDSEQQSSFEADEFESVLDISGKNLELSLFDTDASTSDSVEGIHVYRNVFNLIPKSLGSLGRRLKTLKFFANAIDLFPPEFGDLVGLECLQLKVSSLGISGLPLRELKTLKELELSRAPPKPSPFPLLREIVGLKCLTKLSVCHFSIRYLPPEIGCLDNLEYLDLSFNKMRSLPKEIGSLNALTLFNVANNKLMELPTNLSFLQRLEYLDLSKNRLTSLANIELRLMHNLRNLNLQYNKLLSCCEIPAWICCNLEGNDRDTLSSVDFISSSVEMDVLEATMQDDGSISHNASSNSSSSLLNGSSMSNRCFSTRRMGKRWKRRQYLQQRARQERSKWKVDDYAGVLTVKATEKSRICKEAVPASESLSECASSGIACVDDELEQSIYRDSACSNLVDSSEESCIWSNRGVDLEKCNCVGGNNNGEEDAKCNEYDASSTCLSSTTADHEESLSAEISKSNPTSKRHLDRDLNNHKPRKSRRSTDHQPDISRKYSVMSFCSIEDHLPDGFYDAGRDRPFMSRSNYEHNLDLNSREVILVDREGDEELDAITLLAQAFIFQWKHLNRYRSDQVDDDNLLVASLLALFVSDRFGGSDKSSLIQRVRKDVSGSNYCKPFVCTCSTGNKENLMESTIQNLESNEDAAFCDICEKSLRDIKVRRNSIVIPIGTLQFGVCRHRAILMKYLCDRMEPPVPCELIRGYLDFSPHAWNVILIKRGESWVRMVVDACHPHDIREETDPEYFCRYIPLNRINTPLVAQFSPASPGSFPCLSTCEEIENAASSSLILCKVGSIDTAAKVRKLEVSGASWGEIRQFEYNCLGEVRILCAVKGHTCIVEIYGHQIYSEWIPASDETPEYRVLRSTILMEYVKGGSLKKYIDKLSEDGKKNVPVALALFIARDVAGALKELHSKHIIHRDIKSENILIDLDEKRSDGSPIVKLCDFDRAVPLRSSLHSCCIAHVGIHPPDTCVGTPRWMAPEMLHTMHERENYGMEVDIWSYGCMILELLTLQVPYSGMLDSNIHGLILSGKRPPLKDELEALLGSPEEPAMVKPSTDAEPTDAESEALRFLVDIFHRCTEGNPADRPTAESVYEMLLGKTTSLVTTVDAL